MPACSKDLAAHYNTAGQEHALTWLRKQMWVIDWICSSEIELAAGMGAGLNRHRGGRSGSCGFSSGGLGGRAVGRITIAMVGHGGGSALRLTPRGGWHRRRWGRLADCTTALNVGAAPGAHLQRKPLAQLLLSQLLTERQGTLLMTRTYDSVIASSLALIHLHARSGVVLCIGRKS
jgi:hypothetical protein